MGFPRQEYWSGLAFSFPGDPPDPGTEATSPAWQVNPLPVSHLDKFRFTLNLNYVFSSMIVKCRALKNSKKSCLNRKMPICT